MPWQDTSSLPRSLPVNGELIRYFRKQRGWKQVRLAAEVGYSERLIRKAEKGGSLSPDTIEHLAEALSTSEQPIAPEDLVCDPVAAALAICHAYRRHERQMVSKVASLLADEITVTFAGGEELPFGGVHAAIDGMDRAFGEYFRVFERPDKTLYQPEVFSAGNKVLITATEAVRMPGTSDVIESRVFHTIEFEKGKAAKIEYFYDTLQAAKYLRAMASDAADLSV